MRPHVAICAILLGAVAASAAAAAAAPDPVPAATDWRAVDADNTLVIDTNQGRIIAELSPTAAPNHVARVKMLARAHFYDGLTFFRVIDDFMDQTGDPKNNGQGGSSQPDLTAEFTFRRTPATPFAALSHPPGVDIGFVGALPVQSQTIAMAALMADGAVPAWGVFCSGVLGMARATSMDSANSQFFLMRQAHEDLDRKYTAFGRVVVGLDAVRRIKAGSPVPEPQDRMLKVQVLADMPAASRPKVRVIDTQGAYFAAVLAQLRAARGDDATVCDVDVPGEAR
jgi:peptidylprolyl isomerase